MNIGEYQLARSLGSGSFGQVFLAHKDSKSIALKVEHIRPGTKLCLNNEYLVLKEVQHCPYFPKVYKCGKANRCNYMEMELLGPTVGTVVKETNRPLGIVMWLQAWRHALLALQALHEKGYLHRDVKPSNIAPDLTASRTVLFDLGLAKPYIDFQTNCHIEYEETDNLAGTLLFASLNVLNGLIHSRRDDLESLVLTLMFLRNGGSLPWSGIKDSNKAMKIYRVQQRVSALPIEKICSSAPPQLVETMRYIRALGFEQSPDYEYLLTLAQHCVMPALPAVQLSLHLVPSSDEVGNQSPSGSSLRKTAKRSRKHRSKSQARENSEEETIIVKWTGVKLGPDVRTRIEEYLRKPPM